jgi:hypothetical protein
MSQNVQQDLWDSESQPTGFTQIAEVEWEDQPYQFNLTRVYRHDSGALFYAEDTGCSCPIPFESTTTDHLKPILRIQDWHDHVAARTITADPEQEYQYPEPTPQSALDKAEYARRVISEHLKGSTQK